MRKKHNFYQFIWSKLIFNQIVTNLKIKNLNRKTLQVPKFNNHFKNHLFKTLQSSLKTYIKN